MSRKIKICIVLIDRANYGRMLPLMKEIKKDKIITMQIVCGGSMLFDKFGSTVNFVKKDGFIINEKIHMELEGSTNISMSKSIGLGIIEFSNVFKKLNPNKVVIIGDRYEALAAAIASVYMNKILVHLQGGEKSGSIDESARHAITKLAHIHFPATKKAAENIINMGENKKNVYNFGCPSIELIKKIKIKSQDLDLANVGVGKEIDTNKKFLMIIYHPNTLKILEEKKNIKQLLLAVEKLKLPTYWLWPNIDAGSDIISKEIRKFRENNNPNWLKFIKHLDATTFQKILKKTSCAVGNSSSFIRDSGYYGTPVVLIGDRQNGREKGPNVLSSKINSDEIVKKIKFQLKKKKYKKSTIYGSGNTSKRIIKILKFLNPDLQKKLNY